MESLKPLLIAKNLFEENQKLPTPSDGSPPPGGNNSMTALPVTSQQI